MHSYIRRMLVWFMEGEERMVPVSGHIFSVNIDHGHAAPPASAKARYHFNVLLCQWEVYHLIWIITMYITDRQGKPHTSRYTWWLSSLSIKSSFWTSQYLHSELNSLPAMAYIKILAFILPSSMVYRSAWCDMWQDLRKRTTLHRCTGIFLAFIKKISHSSVGLNYCFACMNYLVVNECYYLNPPSGREKCFIALQ